MRGRWRATIGGLLASAGLAIADPDPSVPPAIPSQLPPLLPVPDANPLRPPAPCPPRSGAGVEYDRSLLYLPDQLPTAPASPPRPPAAPDRFWLNAGAALGWSSPATLPSAVAVPTGSANRVSLVAQNNTPDFRAGLLAEAGRWLDDNKSHGFDAGLMFLQPGTVRVAPLSLPAAAGMPGYFEAAFATRFVSADVAYRQKLYDRPGLRIDGLIGYRFAYVGEDATTNVVQAGITTAADQINTRTIFNGGQVGFAAQYRWERWAIDLTTRLGLGAVHEESSLVGSSRAVGFSPDAVRFAVLPAVALNVGRQVTDYGRIFAGYHFQYLSQSARAGDVLAAINDPAGTRPRPDFWAQGISLGVEVRY